MTSMTELGLLAAILVGYTLLVWHAHDWYDGYHQTAAIQAEADAHVATEKHNNVVADRYEANRAVRTQTIQSIQQKVEEARAKDTSPCPVPSSVLQAIRAANAHGLSR